MMPYLTGKYGNPGSLHAMGREAAAAVENARQQVASFIGAKDPEQIIFTGGGTEGNNMVFNGLSLYVELSGRDAIMTSSFEHDSVLSSVKRARFGGWCTCIEVVEPDSNGIVTTETVSHCIEKLTSKRPGCKIGLISIMSANNELGTLNPVHGICRIAHDHDALFHTDAVQAAGLYPLDVYRNDYDFVTISSHKIHGPKGVGALYASDWKGTMLRPLIRGGRHQEFGLRGGTENVAGIVGFGKACELMSFGYEERDIKREQLAERFLYRLRHEFLGKPDGFEINGTPPEDFKTVSLRFDGVDAQTLLLMLDARGIAVSAGSACTAHEDTPSHVLLSIGLTLEQARSTIRVSFSDKNTLEEVDKAAMAIVKCVSTLRGET